MTQKSKTIMNQAQLAVALAAAILGSGYASSSHASSALSVAGEPAPRAWGVDELSATVDSNLYETSGPSHSVNSTFTLNTYYKPHDLVKVNLVTSFRKELTGLRDSSFEDMSLTVARKAIVLNPNLSYTPGIGLAIPTSLASRTEASFLGGVQLRNTLALSAKSGPLANVIGRYRLVVSRAFHQYTTNFSGGPNARYKLSNLVVLGYKLTDKLSVSATGIQNIGWSYQNNPATTYELAQEIGYGVTNNFSVAAGHSNSGNAFKENGKDLNVSVFDGTSSIVYGTVSFTY